MKYLAVVTVACCDFIGHVLPGCHATLWQSSASCSIFRLSFVIRTHAGIVSLPLNSSNIQRHSQVPFPPLLSLPLNFKSFSPRPPALPLLVDILFKLINFFCHCFARGVGGLICSALIEEKGLAGSISRDHWPNQNQPPLAAFSAILPPAAPPRQPLLSQRAQTISHLQIVH